MNILDLLREHKSICIAVVSNRALKVQKNIENKEFHKKPHKIVNTNISMMICED